MKKPIELENLWFEKGKPLTPGDFVKGETYEINPRTGKTRHVESWVDANGKHQMFGAPPSTGVCRPAEKLKRAPVREPEPV